MKNIEIKLNKQELKDKLGILPPATPEETRDNLELLRGAERLDKSAIKGLDDYDQVKKKAFEKKGDTYYGGSGISSLPNWNVNKESVAIGETFTIPTGYEFFLATPFTVDGTLIVNGDFVSGTPSVLDYTVTAITADYFPIVTGYEQVILADATAGDIRIYLPLARKGSFSVKKTDSSANKVYVVPALSQTIDGDPYKGILFQNTAIPLIPYQNNWYINK